MNVFHRLKLLSITCTNMYVDGKHQTKKGNKCRIAGKGGETKRWGVIQCKKQDLTIIPLPFLFQLEIKGLSLRNQQIQKVCTPAQPEGCGYVFTPTSVALRNASPMLPGSFASPIVYISLTLFLRTSWREFSGMLPTETTTESAFSSFT